MSEPTPSFDDLLDSLPVRSESVELAESGLHAAVLRVPLRRRWYMRAPLSWMLPLRTHRALALDAPGREVWEMCDGQTTTETIIDRFSRSHYLSFHEARLAVMQYMQMLTRNGLIAMVGAGPAEGCR